MTDRAQAIFEEIIDLPTEDRNEALDQACRHDEPLRAQVNSLLAAHDQAGQFLGEPTIDHVAAYSKPAEQAGMTIGRYKLLEKIGQGGFGDVYMAQQLEPVKRRIALKIIKLGMDTKQVIARFEAERQALALMDHPNIARVLDGGETDSGRPYFVMELVKGDPITAYCDREKLSTLERLKLFQQVCQAIQHAHQKGVIHRDIKPSNVLVTVADGEPMTKVIDFGIAKATNTELTEKTLFTEFRQLIGTPQYMSPEQAERSGVDIDTRSDIYSLGVLLYEMLTGRTPVDPTAMKSAVWEELQRMIREDEPQRPSTLVTTLGPDSELIAKSRGTEPTRLGNTLKGDLDWIILKALEKDRTRRYGAASELSDDIQRYLSDEAVMATPPSVSYKLGKLLKRNKATIAVASALTAALLVGLIATSTTAVWAMRERDNALAAEQKVRKASVRAEQQARRARHMLTMTGNAFRDKSDLKDLAQARRADLEYLKQSKEISEREILSQECEFSVWWLYNQGGAKASKLIEQLYERAKPELGIEDPIFLALINAHLQAHINEYDADRIADLYGDLLEAVRIQKPQEFEVLLPQYAAALHKAKRNDEATQAIDEYLTLRNGDRPNSPNVAAEKIRLQANIRDLAEWGKNQPEKYEQLKSMVKQLESLANGTTLFPAGAAKPKSRQIWEGTLDIGQAKLRLRFDIAKSKAGDFSGKLVSLDQNNAEIPLSSMTADGGLITMKFDAAKAKFVGQLNEEEDKTVGKWTQGGKEFDFIIKRIGH